MNSFQWFLLVYVTGGVTFLPLVLYVFWVFKQKIDSINEANQRDFDREPLVAGGIDPNFKAGEFEEEKGVNVVRQGWLHVTRKYYYHHTDLACQDEEDTDNIPQRSQIKKKHRFYAILKHGNLFLYRDNSSKSNLVHAISLQDSFITIWPRKPGNELPEGVLFTKKTCISILRKGTTSISNGVLKFDTKTVDKDDSQTTNQFFLYIDSNLEKEDWYFSLISVSKSDVPKSRESSSLIDPNVTARTAHLITADTLGLIQTINSTEGQLSTKWLNALIGRLFLAVQGTDRLKNYLYTKLYQKLAKIKRPDFLDDFVVEEVDVGTSAPILTNPKLLDLTPEGLMKISMNFSYKGDLSVIVATKATINLGSHFRQREVPIQLSIKLRELSGPLVIQLKPPPSNRLWYTFQSEPVLSLEIEPVVSSSKLSYAMITNAIKSKFAEAVKESLVHPFWDDIVFYDTEGEIYRGGIWEKYDTKRPKKCSENRPSSVPSEWGLDPEHKHTRSQRNGRNDLSPNEDPITANGASLDDDEEIQNTLRTQDSALKRRTFPNVDNLRKALKNKSREDLDDDRSSNDSFTGSSIVPGDSADSVESATSNASNKLFKSSIKKFGKWYRENVSLADESPTQEALSEHNSNPPSPEMISSRRKSLPRRPLPATIPSASVFSSDPVSPTTNATEMFANKEQKNARTSVGSGDVGFGPGLAANFQQGHNQAFVKVKSNELEERVFQEEFVRKVSTTRTTQLSENSSVKHEQVKHEQVKHEEVKHEQAKHEQAKRNDHVDTKQGVGRDGEAI